MGHVPIELESVVSEHTQHYKTSYKTFLFDFFKPDGYAEEFDKISGGADPKKKQRKLM